MDKVLSLTTTATPQNRYLQAASWFSIAAVAAALSIVLHEFAHYLTALATSASDVSFHWAYVDHDSSSVSAASNALIAWFGPLSSYALVAAAWWYTQKSTSVFALALGFSAAFRSFGMLPYTIRSLLGRDVSSFYFDEIRGANALGISPLIPSVLSLLVFLVGTVYFSRKAKRESGALLMFVMLVGIFAGVYAWGVFGPMLFPGGAGFN